MNEEIAVTANR